MHFIPKKIIIPGLQNWFIQKYVAECNKPFKATGKGFKSNPFINNILNYFLFRYGFCILAVSGMKRSFIIARIEFSMAKMPASKTILLLFEDGDIREESLHYSIELARRTGCALRVMMLLDTAGNEMEEVWRKRFNDIFERCRTTDLPYQGEIRCGDKASELLKFLALTSMVSTVVWGSDENVLTGQGERKSRHWFAKVRTEFQCPIVTSRARRK